MDNNSQQSSCCGSACKSQVQNPQGQSAQSGNVTVFNTDPTLFLDYQIQKQIKSLYKEYLFLIEKIFNSHDEFLAKFRSTLPEQYQVYVDMAEFLTDSKYEEIRKEVLDRGNQSIRAIDEELKKYNIDFKK